MKDSAELIVREALALIERECPTASANMKASLGATQLALAIGDEQFQVAFSPAVELDTLEVRVKPPTLVEIVEGRLSVHEAITSDLLFIRGQVPALIASAEAALWFLKGALRSRDSETLISRLSELP